MKSVMPAASRELVRLPVRTRPRVGRVEAQDVPDLLSRRIVSPPPRAGSVGASGDAVDGGSGSSWQTARRSLVAAAQRGCGRSSSYGISALCTLEARAPSFRRSRSAGDRGGARGRVGVVDVVLGAVAAPAGRQLHRLDVERLVGQRRQRVALAFPGRERALQPLCVVATREVLAEMRAPAFGPLNAPWATQSASLSIFCTRYAVASSGLAPAAL